MASPQPRIDYDPEVEADCIVKVSIGEIVCWFAMTSEGDRLIAFAINDGEGRTCRDPEADEAEIIKELTLSFPGRRCCRCFNDKNFTADWERRTGKYLFPKKVGKIRVEMPLNADTPLNIMADWLQDHGCDRAAAVLRLHHEPTGHKEQHKAWDKHVRKLWADYAEHHGPFNPHTTTVAQLLLWSHSQTINTTEVSP